LGQGAGDDVSLGAFGDDFEDVLLAEAGAGMVFAGQVENTAGVHAYDVDPDLFAGQFENGFVGEGFGGIGKGRDELVGGFKGHGWLNLEFVPL
jgi:hypothetical protein